MRTLIDFQEFNPLCSDTLGEVCALVMCSPAAQSELFQADLKVIEAALSGQLRELAQRSGKPGRAGGMSRLLGLLESALDAGNLVKRRR